MRAAWRDASPFHHDASQVRHRERAALARRCRQVPARRVPHGAPRDPGLVRFPAHRCLQPAVCGCPVPIGATAAPARHRVHRRGRGADHGAGRFSPADGGAAHHVADAAGLDTPGPLEHGSARARHLRRLLPHRLDHPAQHARGVAGGPAAGGLPDRVVRAAADRRSVGGDGR